MSYVTVVLFSSAITVVFTRGTVFASVRERGPKLWRELASCPLCVGVWVGGLVALLFAPRFVMQRVPTFEADGWFLVLFLAVALGSLTGCLSLLFVRVSDTLGSFEALLDHELESKKRWEEQARSREQLRAARASGGEPPP